MTTATTPVSTVLSDALAAGRPHFNARVAEVRHRQPAFDVAAFSAFLRTGVEAVAQSVVAVAPDRTSAAVASAYDIALELVAQGLAGPGARSTHMDQTWTAVAPRCGRLLATQPFEVLGMLSNAVAHLTGQTGARPQDWIDDMVRLAEHAASVEQLRLLGQVVAWRAGLAQFREGALHAADSLPPMLALLALGTKEPDRSDAWQTVRQAHRADPWWCESPQRRESLRQGVVVGQFTGFGGGFAEPPQVRANPIGFTVHSAGRFSLLMADAYGAVLLPSNETEYDEAAGAARPPAAKVTGNHLVIAGRSIELDLPVDSCAVVENERSVALTSAYSHAIRVYPRA